MNLLGLSFSYLRSRPLTTALNLLLLAFGTAVIALLALLSQHLEGRIARDGAGFDMVVGAKGSPVQLILSSIYHADIPTGNISYAEYGKLRKNPMVRQVVPLALGDSVEGFRIVGTTLDYPKHYRADLARGEWFAAPFDAVMGAVAAKATGAKPGDEFFGVHGLVGGGDVHKEFHYTVKGIMAPTGTVLDRLVLTPVKSVWEIHEHHHHEHHRKRHHEEEDHHHKEKEITALLVSFSAPAAAAVLPRQINTKSKAQAAAPAFEMARLLSVLGVGLDAIRALGAALVAMAMLGVFVALWQAMEQRRYDLAVMRGLGASRAMLLRLVLLEGLFTAALGGLMGLVLTQGGLALAAGAMPEMGIARLQPEQLRVMGEVFAVILGCGALASLLPALRAYHLEVARTLAAS